MALGRLTLLLAPAVAALTMLVTGLPGARADICKNQNPKSGCVDSTDVQNQSLGLIELKDEAGSKFDSGGNLGRLGGTDKSVTASAFLVPRKGWVVATATIELAGQSGASGSSARCQIEARVGTGPVAATKVFYESVSPEKGIDRTSVAATLGFRVETKQLVTARLLCRKVSGGVIRATGGGMTLQYFATRYKP